jgi:dnd system-associated protein 4
MPRRAKRPKNKEKIFKKLVNGDEYGLFETMKDVFMIAAIVGYNTEQKKEFDNYSGQIPWSVFNEQDKYLMNIIALADTKNIEIVLEKNSDKKLKIVEEYVNGGIDKIKRQIIDKPGDGLDNLIEFIINDHAEEDKILRDLDLSSEADNLF